MQSVRGTATQMELRTDPPTQVDPVHPLGINHFPLLFLFPPSFFRFYPPLPYLFSAVRREAVRNKMEMWAAL